MTKLFTLLFIAWPIFQFDSFGNDTTDRFQDVVCVSFPPFHDEIDGLFMGDSTVNDLVILEANYGNLTDSAEHPWRNLEYSEYPMCQVRSIDFSVTVANVGTSEQTGVFLEVHFTDNELVNELLTSSTQSIAQGDTVTFTIFDYLPPNTQGTYDILYTIYQDQQDITPENNLAFRSFKISENYVSVYTGNSTEESGWIFSRDDGEITTSVEDMGTGDSFQAGIGYYFTADDVICCLGAAFTEDSEPGTEFTMQLKDGSEPFDFLAETFPIVIQQPSGFQDNFQWGAIEFNVPIFDGDPILAVVDIQNPNNANVALGINHHHAPDSSAYKFGVFNGQDCTDGCPTNDAYMIRIGLSDTFCTTRIAEKTEHITAFYCSPNPAHGQVTVHYTALEQIDIELVVFDNLGRVVTRQKLGNHIPGVHSFVVDTASLTSGNYTVSLLSGKTSISTQLIIQ